MIYLGLCEDLGYILINNDFDVNRKQWQFSDFTKKHWFNTVHIQWQFHVWDHGAIFYNMYACSRCQNSRQQLFQFDYYTVYNQNMSKMILNKIMIIIIPYFVL